MARGLFSSSWSLKLRYFKKKRKLCCLFEQHNYRGLECFHIKYLVSQSFGKSLLIRKGWFPKTIVCNSCCMLDAALVCNSCCMLDATFTGFITVLVLTRGQMAKNMTYILPSGILFSHKKGWNPKKPGVHYVNNSQDTKATTAVLTRVSWKCWSQRSRE